MGPTGETPRKAEIVSLDGVANSRGVPPLTAFQRRELGIILKVYGQKVAEGEWRDYAIDHGRDEATFSIFRRSSEVPLFRITKTPKLARRQGAYTLISAGGMILKRGHDLEQVLRVFAKKRHLSLVSG